MGEAKAKKQRSCPAVGRTIPSIECAENRISRYACPADCPFNPWRPEAYDEYLKIDEHLRDKMTRRLFAESDRRGVLMSPPGDDLELGEFFRQRQFVERDETGRTFTERWADDGYAGLNNDERVLHQAQSRMSVKVLELQGSAGEIFSTAVDLLAPDQPELLVADRALAAVATRFYRFIGWFLELPCYGRLFDHVVTVMHVGGMEPRAIFEAIARHRGGLAPGESLASWLGAHYGETTELLKSLPTTLQTEGMRRSGIKQCLLAYDLTAPRAEVAALFTSEQGFETTSPLSHDFEAGFDACWDWFDTDPPAHGGQVPRPAGSMPVRGAIALSDRRLLLKASVTADPTRVRERLDRLLGGRAAFVSESEVDLGLQYASDLATPAQLAAVPPEILANAPVLAVDVAAMRDDPVAPVDEHTLMRDLAARWADEPVPGLDGRTPRQAATDPALRPRLLQMMKKIVFETDRRQDREGGEDDPSSVIRDLGLHEIDVPARHGLYDPDHRPASDPEPDPLSRREIEARIREMHEQLPTFEELLARFAQNASFIHDFLHQRAGSWSPEAFDLQLCACAEAWVVLFGDDLPVEDPDLLRIADSIEALAGKILSDKDREADALLQALTDECRQPELLDHLLSMVTELVEDSPEDERPQPVELMRLFMTLRAIVDEFDRISPLA